MINLNLPLPHISSEKIFEECVNGFVEEKASGLIRCKEVVKSDSAEYTNPALKERHLFQSSNLPESVTNEMMKSVYREKFARANTPGRKYYDEIIAAPRCGKCPLCGEGLVSTLDHFLPQKTHPTLVVTPANLVPACADCNKIKSAETLPLLHPYFDYLPNEIWLYSVIQKGPAIQYYVSCPSDWDIAISLKVQNHFETFKLNRLYINKACGFLDEHHAFFKSLLEAKGETELKAHIEELLRSYEKTDLNSWKSALLRSVLSNFDTFKEYVRD